MTDIKPRFFDHPDLCIRFMEWQAIKSIVFKGKHKGHYDYFDAYSQRWSFWSDHYQDHSKENHKQIMVQVGNGAYQSMDDFYNAINKMLKPRKLGKALKDAKRRTAQAAARGAGGRGAPRALYVAGGKGLAVFDLANPDLPRKVGKTVDTGVLNYNGGAALALHIA